MSAAYSWYSQLKKPTWSPPPWLFAPVWTVLYIVIAITFGYVLFGFATAKYSWAFTLPFMLNLIFNFTFTPLQFRLKSNILAMTDILLVLFTLVWALAVAWPRAPWIVYVNIPYLLWVTFATVLQVTVTYLNRATA
jgi:tryptophan-rich sensory protein